MPKIMNKPETEPSKIDPERRDVVIYEIATGKVSSFAGINMTSYGHYNYGKRVLTAQERCNEHYSAVAVPVRSAT